MAGIPRKGGLKGRSGPPGNQNAFRHGLAAIGVGGLSDCYWDIPRHPDNRSVSSFRF